MVSKALRCRQISDADIAAVATLLAVGFHRRNREFWLKAFECLKHRQPPPSLPKYGYLLESDGIPVGALLLICTTVRIGDTATPRCSVSSWYVDPQFRPYAPLLVSHALRNKDVTYINVSPASHTLSIIEAQGFTRYSGGVFVAIPSPKALLWEREPVQVLEARQCHPTPVAHEQALLLEHAAFGCASFWCVTRGRAYPFVFRSRRVKGIIPCVQLIYCRDVSDFVRFAAPLTLALARRGKLMVIIDANGPIPGLIGRYFPDKTPKYFRGAQPPRLGDLAYTEAAMLEY